jgi:hypothetical protein
MKQTTYKKLKEIVYKMCNDYDTRDDLIQDIAQSLLNNEKFDSLNENAKTYYLVGIVRRQVYSTNSSYYRTFKKFNGVELTDRDTIPDVPYSEEPTMDWVREELENELKRNPKFWYNKQLFELYLEKKGFIDRVHKQTKIPRYAIKDTVNEVKGLLKQRWKIYKEL